MSEKKIKQNYLNKIKELQKHNKLYYVESSPIISDKDYDFVGKLCRDHENETVRDFANAVMNLEDWEFTFYKEEYEKLKPFFKIALDKEYEKYKKRPKFEIRKS